VAEFFTVTNAGYASENFRADRPLILFSKPGESAVITIVCEFMIPTDCSYVSAGKSASGHWIGGWFNSQIQFEIVSKQPGATLFTFHNGLNDECFSVLAIVNDSIGR